MTFKQMLFCYAVVVSEQTPKGCFLSLNLCFQLLIPAGDLQGAPILLLVRDC